MEPSSLYSKTKARSEEIVKQATAGWTIVRPSLVIGFSPNTTNDRPFNRILKNLDEKTPAVYDTSWQFQVTYLRHLFDVLRVVIERNVIGEIIPVATEGLKSRYDIAHDILKAFNIAVTSVNNNDPTPVTIDNLATLKRLHLPQYTYEEVIADIVDEIKNREKFHLD